MQVRWLPVPGYEGLYVVSNDGRIRSCMSGVDRKLSLEHGTRPMVQLWSGGKAKMHKVCRLVLFAFCGQPPVSSWVASHLNGDCKDNRPENLTWESQGENIRRMKEHGTLRNGELSNFAKLSEFEVAAIRAASGTQHSIAKKFGINQSQVSRIKSGKRWEHSRQESVQCQL